MMVLIIKLHNITNDLTAIYCSNNDPNKNPLVLSLFHTAPMPSKLNCQQNLADGIFTHSDDDRSFNM